MSVIEFSTDNIVKCVRRGALYMQQSPHLVRLPAPLPERHDAHLEEILGAAEPGDGGESPRAAFQVEPVRGAVQAASFPSKLPLSSTPKVQTQEWTVREGGGMNTDVPTFVVSTTLTTIKRGESDLL